MIGSLLWPYLFTLLTTSAIMPDVDTDAASSSPARDSLSLVDLYLNTNGPSWKNTWDLTMPMDTWFGVTLNDNRCVTNLNLAANDLEGQIPASIGFLIELTELNLQLNSLEGPIPKELGNLFRLEFLSLFGNRLSGSIPKEIGMLTSLTMLTCASNELDGAIPTTFGNLKLLKRLFLDRNKIVGFLPSELGDLDQLEVLDVHNNQIEGPIPSNFGGLKSLREMLLYQNNFFGEVPNGIADLDSLEFLWLYENNFSGAFPPLANPVLKSIRIDQNHFDQLPDLSTLPALELGFPNGISVEGNKLSFDDILLNIGIQSWARFAYRPQDTLWKEQIIYVNQGDRIEIRLPFDDTVRTSTYKWYKDSSLQQITNFNSLTIVNAQSVDEGSYHVEIENSVVGDLRLITRSFELVVRDSAECNIPMAGVSCGTAPASCSPLLYDLYCGSLSPSFDTLSCNDLDLSGELSWLGFIADTGRITFDILPYSCSSSSAGIQAAIYKNCRGKELVQCTPSCENEDFSLTLEDPEPGTYYYLAIKSCGGQCKFQLRVEVEGSDFKLDLNGQITGQDSICGLDETWIYGLSDVPTGADQYEWIVGTDTVYTSQAELGVQWTRLGSILMCVRAVSSCDTSRSLCQIVNVFPGLKLKNVDFEKVRNDSFYVLSFGIEGGIGPIVIDSLSGVYNAVSKTFVSDPIRCGKPYYVSVVDKNGCSQILTGDFICNCTSSGGRLKEDVLSACEGDSIQIDDPIGDFLDSTDTNLFVLMPSRTFEPSQIIASNKEGIFYYDSLLMQRDKVHYVFYLVGNEVNNQIDFKDPCLALSNPQPILFSPIPMANAGSDTFYCQRVFNLRAIKSNTRNDGRWEQIDGPAQAMINDETTSLTAVEVFVDGVYQFSWTEFNDCMDVDTIQIEIKPELNFVIAGPDTLCREEEGELMASGQFISITWTDGDTSRNKSVQGPGRYCATAEDRDGCVKFLCIDIQERDLNVQILGDLDICEGDETTIQVVPIYKNYSWNTGDSSFYITVDSAGEYCITVEDFNGCYSTKCVEVTTGGSREFNVSDTLCFGDSLELGGESFYLSGQYVIPVTDSSGQNCDSVINLDLLVYDSIFIADQLIVRDDGTGNGSISVDIRGGLRPFKFRWSNGATSPFINNLKGDIYILVVEDARGCTATFSFDVRKGVAVNNLERAFLKLIPNPVKPNAGVHIKFKQNPGRSLNYVLYHSNGTEVRQGIVYFDVQSKSGFIPMEDINVGVYLLRISDSYTGEAFIHRIVVSF